MIRKLFRNAKIFTASDPGIPLTGKRLGEILHFERGAVFCQDGVIKAIGDEKDVEAPLSPRDVDVEVDCAGFCLIPGFVDPHTHMCFAKRREEEFILRMQGAEYLEILRRGGGILSSVRAVRAASEEELLSVTREHALSALEFGTTTLEIKSGYGLDTDTELKMLRVIDRVGRETPLDVVPTFLGAHAVPEEYAHDPDTYVDMLIEEMIPAVSDQGIARFCDVFCEKGVFSLEQSRRILVAAREAGLGVKIHADEVHDLGGAGLAAELSATSAEHLLAAGDVNLEAMANQGVMAVLLPATAYSLRKAYAPARKMIDYGVPVALATDCNPGSSYTESMPFVFGLAVLEMNLSVSEALAATTLNGAYAVGMAKQVGSLDVSKSADFLLLDGESPAILAYHAGVSPVVEVYKRAELVARN
ncbi:MAG TPA: imidazolonepropionase [Desulfatiglandales bacterium]|nr:imidazolonepropionase [Desulfatiglandales bacterium]